MLDKDLRKAQDDARYYRERYEEEAENRRREEERRWEDDQRRRRERQSEISRSFRQADTWPEALRKQASLCRVEIDETVDDYFTEVVAACETALTLWESAEAETAPAIEELQRQIDAIKTQVAVTVAERLAGADTSSAAQEIVMLMIDPAPDFDDWLSW